MNPAMAGAGGVGRFVSAYRDQWAGRYKTIFASYDQYMKKLKGGLGLNALLDYAGTLKTQRVELDYAYRHGFFEKGNIHVAASAAYQNKHLDLVTNGFGPSGSFSKDYLDFSAGLLAYWKKFNVGVSVDHLTEPDESLIPGSSETKLPMQYTAHFSTQFGQLPDESGKGKCFGAQGRYTAQGPFSTLDLGVNAQLWRIQLGFSFSNGFAGSSDIFDADILTLRLGFRKGRFNVAYNFDLYSNRPSNGAYNQGHEAVAGFELFRKKMPEGFQQLKPLAF